MFEIRDEYLGYKSTPTWGSKGNVVVRVTYYGDVSHELIDHIMTTNERLGATAL